jgi:hypothetical protein
MIDSKNKSLVIAMHEAENTLISCVNEVIKTSGLPCSVIEMIFDSIHWQLKNGARAEFETERRRMIEAEKLENRADRERAKMSTDPEKEEALE